MDKELVAPCGMDCGICKRFLALSKGQDGRKIKILGCSGCRTSNRKCAFLKGRCDNLTKGKVVFCFQCENFPCVRLKHLDQRYRKSYNMSMIDNLEFIKNSGLDKFLKKEKKRWSCPKCKGTVSCHNGICSDCGFGPVKMK